MRFAFAPAAVVFFGFAACSSPAKVKPAPAAQKEIQADREGASAKEAGAATPKADVPDLKSSAFPLSLWAAFLAQRDYVDPGRFSNEAQMDSALAALESHEPKLFARRNGPTITVWTGDWSKRYPMPETQGMRAIADRMVEILGDLIDLLKLEGEKRHELEYAAFNGLLEPLDPHTNLLNPKQNASLGVRTRGHFGGIGAEIWAEDRRIRIVRVLPDNPAEKAGLMDNDLLYQIDGRSTVNMGASEAQGLLRGPVGTKVKVIVQRKKQLKTLTITRGKISIPSTRSFTLPDKTGYVELLSFQEGCAQETLDAMKAQVKAGNRALVLDLRRNTGGLLTEAIALVDGFVQEGELISVHSRSGKEVEKANSAIQIRKNIPLVILISQTSASASEIVSGALSKLGRAVVVGRRSFGKGSVQQLMTSHPYGEELALKLTIAEYRVAGDTKIQGRGVVPTLALYPMRLGDHRGVGLFFDQDRFERLRENEVYDRLAQTKVEPSPYQLRYLARTPWEKVPQDLKDQAQRAWLDPELRIAAGLGQALALVKVERRTETQDQTVQAFVHQQSKEQQKALTDALKRWKIDWSPAPAKQALQDLEGLKFSAQVVAIERPTKLGKSKKIVRKSALGPDKLLVGDVFTLRLRLDNQTGQDLYRVHMRTEYFLPELDGLEVVFGKIRNKARPYIDLRLQVPPGRSAHVGDYKFSVYSGEASKTPILTESVDLVFELPELPKLEFNYWIVDSARAAKKAPARPKHEVIKGEAPFVVQGDGNGRVSPGEKVLIAFEVINKGKTTASIPSLVVRNRSRAQALLEEGAASLDKLGPGKRVYGSIAMTVAKDADASKPIDLQLLVGDRKSSQVVERELHLPVFSAAQAKGFVAMERVKWMRNTVPLEVRGAPEPSSALLGVVEPKQNLAVVGQRGEQWAVDLGRGRLVWVKAKKEELLPGRRAKARWARDLKSMVVPPTLEMEVPRSSDKARLAIEGIARDDGALEDVVVWTVPEERGAKARKLLYEEAGPEKDGKPRTQMRVETDVDLVKGPQRIRVVVRDKDKVATKRDFWVQVAKPES